MRNLLLSTQVIFFFVFVIAFIASFFVVDDLQEKSKVAVTEKVVVSTSSNVAFVEELLNSKAATTYLADYQLETIHEEIDTFKGDPYRYVESLTLDEAQTTIIPPDLKSNNPLKNALMEKVFSWKSGIKDHFNKTFEGLVTDIRIFIVSNIFALLVAALVCYKQNTLGKESMVVSSILTGVIALSSLSYLDQNWLFTIILNSYSGYSYPVGILMTTLWLYYEYYSRRNEN